MDTRKSPEVWDRLSNESGRAHEAFKVYMYMSPAERSVVRAWREWTGNPEAARPSPFFEGWARENAWPARAGAHDHHLELVRRRGMEKAIELAAEEQARQAERTRNHLSELMAVGYLKTMDFLEQMDPADMRFSEAVQVARLHIEHVDKFGSGEEGVREDDWSEEDAEIERIAKEIKSRRNSEEGAQSPEEEDSESDDADEVDSEDSEGDET